MNDRARRIAAPALAILATVLLLGALVAGYGARALLNADQFADRAAAALDEESVADEIGRRAADQLIAADPDLISVRPVLEEIVSGAVGSGAFRDVFRAAVADVHRAVFNQDQDTVAFTIADIGAVARGALQAINPKLAEQIPANTAVAVMQSDPPQFVVEVTKLRSLPWILLAVAVLLIGAAIWLAPDNRRTVILLGVAMILAGVLGALGLDLIRAHVLGEIERGSARDAADAIWRAFFGDLHRALILFGVVGAVITAAGSSLLQPVDVRVPLRRAWNLAASVPESRLWRAVRGALLLAAGILVVIEHEFVIDLIAILGGLFLAYAGAAELMRLTLSPRTAKETAAERRAAARPLVAATVCSALILLVGGMFIGVGGASEEPAEIETVGCNGGDELCDRSLDRVAFPSTHNSMSAASNPGWLFAQQEKGFPDQLRDGIRGLLIDAHYGQPTESGSVKTDLSNVDSTERATYEAELGSEAFDAALRIRDRIINSPPTGPRQVYLCHAFCELGAIPIDKAFADLRDFLAAYPNEVLVIVIEDYVDPDEIAAAAEGTGLLDFVYTGELTDPLPTLREMVESNGRVVMLAENDAGGGSIPWYHEAYDELLQETPYSFKKPGELTDPQRLAASCEPNRGPETAQLFLINHWIDTSPAPKPSNAKKVNAHDALLARVRECEQIRALSANLIAVDFYREGDLFGVVDELNRER